MWKHFGNTFGSIFEYLGNTIRKTLAIAPRFHFARRAVRWGATSHGARSSLVVRTTVRCSLVRTSERYFGCFSDVRGPFRTNNPPKSPKISKQRSYENCSHFWKIEKSQNISKHMFKPCSYILLNTQNPNTIFKTIIYCTKCTQNTKTPSNKTHCFRTDHKNLKSSKYSNYSFEFCIIYIIIILYFLYIL